MLPTAAADLVLLDILMPGIDGYEVCRRIRTTPGFEFLPVVMITASGEQEKIRAIEAGADDFVSKPFNQGELLARVASLARVKRYQDTIERQAAELAEWNARAGVPGARPGRRAPAGEPPAQVPLAAAGGSDHRLGRRDLPRQSSPRDRGGVLRPARVHAVRRIERARRGDGGARRVPHRPRRADPPVRGDAGAIHRRRSDGVLQRSAGVRRRRRACGDDGGGHARPRRLARRRVAPARSRPRPRASASPRDSRRWAGSGSRGGSTMRRSAASRIWLRACAARPRSGRSSSRSACSRRPRDSRWGSRWASSTCADSAGRSARSMSPASMNRRARLTP